jgi:hypothetical protein
VREEESKDDDGELDNYNANEVEGEDKSVPINFERISLTRGNYMGNWGQNEDNKESKFINWHKDENDNSESPPLLMRLEAFLKIAKWEEIYVPSMAFRKVYRKLVGWAGSSLSIIFLLTTIFFVLGFFTSGYYWPKEIKVYLFFGDENEGLTELQEIKEELKRGPRKN